MKPYRYRQQRIATPEYTRENVQRAGDQEVLTGQVQGMDASDLEERVARALDKLEISYGFRERITSDAIGSRQLTQRFANVKGEVEIDMLCDVGGQMVPVFVDGQISHYFTPYQADKDKEKTDITNEFGRQFGWREAIRLPFWDLQTQDMTDRTVRNALRP